MPVSNNNNGELFDVLFEQYDKKSLSSPTPAPAPDLLPYKQVNEEESPSQPTAPAAPVAPAAPISAPPSTTPSPDPTGQSSPPPPPLPDVQP